MKKYFLMLFAFECVCASVVNSDFYYQDYLDFALNKGKFKVGTKDIQIISKNGKIINFNAPMVDFNAANISGRLKGEFTNIGQSFVVSAAHMTWGEKGSGSNKGPLKQGDTLYFANVANRVVAASNDFRSRNTFDIDFAVFKMQKLNLNISANLSKELDFIEKVSNVKEESLRYEDKFQKIANDSKADFSIGKGKLYDTNRYEYFVREGTGIQGIGDIDINNRPIKIANDDKYHTGGFVTLGDKDDIRYRFELNFSNYKNGVRNDFTSSSAPGDSGSALYVYDKLDKKWYLVGVISTSNCNMNFTTGYYCTLVNYALINQPLIDEFKDARTIKIAGGNYILDKEGLKQNGEMIKGVEFISEKNFAHITFNDGNSRIVYENRIKEMAKSKDLYFSQNGNIVLLNDVDLGASVLNFTPNSKWEIKGDKWFINGGIYADKNSKIIYDTKLKENDFLYKMGKGELEIKSNNINSGLRMGEGLVNLSGEGKKFGEIYINGGMLKISNANNIDLNTLYLNGGTLDLNGQKLNTDVIKANSNNVFITSSKENANFTFSKSKDYIYHGNFASDNNFKLDIRDSQMIFDGNIYNAKGVMNIDNSKVNFQGHPMIHSYLDDQTLTHLKKFGQDVFAKGVRIDQKDWENRVFVLKELNLHNAFFNLSSYATLAVLNLNAKDSSVVLGSNEINIDEKDGENILSNNAGNDYGYKAFTGIGKEMFYQQELKNSNRFETREVYFKGNLNLENSNTFIYKTTFDGNINALNNDKIVTLSHSNFKGKISAKNLDLNNNTIFGGIQASNLNALNNTFNLDIAKDNIISTQSTSGKNNTILLNLVNLVKNSKKSILLASLADSKDEINEKYFSFPNLQKAFSTYTPNVEFSHDEQSANWILTKIETTEPNLENAFFHTSDNTKALNTANSLVDHFILNYIAEWNNMQKRMGELRDNPYGYGIWFRSFGGKLSDENSDGNYFELQMGLDKQSEFSNFNLYSGFMLNFTQTKLDSDSLDATSKGYGLGQYFSFLFDNDLYLDFVLRYIRYENDMSASFLPSVNSSLNSKASNNIISSLELGYRKYFDNLYFEPQIELISGYVDNIHLYNENVDIKLDSYMPLVLKTAFFTGVNVSEKLNLKAGFGYMSDLKRSGKKSFSDTAGTRDFDGLKDDRVFINLNTSYKVNEKTRLNLDFEKSFFGDLNIDWSVNANLRYSF